MVRKSSFKRWHFEERSEEVRKRVTPISVEKVASKDRGVLRNKNEWTTVRKIERSEMRSDESWGVGLKQALGVSVKTLAFILSEIVICCCFFLLNRGLT